MTISDEQLIQSIANRRDIQAFEQLVFKYQGAMYSLAVNILGGTAQAEDVVQESLLRVWKSADRFKSDGNVRAWMMKIVSRRALTFLRKSARKKEITDKAQSAGVLDAYRLQALPGDNSEQQELISLLREQVWQLEPDERRLLALYYGGGVSQYGIAEALSMPQRTVSKRLNSIVDSLRRNLAQSGIGMRLQGASVPAGLLAMALQQGHAAPAGLLQGVLGSLAPAAASLSVEGSAAGSASTALGGMIKGKWLLGVIFLFVLASIGLYLHWEPSTLSDPLPEQKTSASQHPTRQIPMAEPHAADGHGNDRANPSGFDKIWANFDVPPLSLFEEKQGNWVWVSNTGRNGTGGMRTRGVILALLADLPDGVYRISFDFQNNTKKATAVGVSWEGETPLAVFNRLGTAPPPAHNGWQRAEFVVSGEFRCDVWSDGLRRLEFAKRNAGSRLLLRFKGSVQIDNFSIAKVNPDEIPDVQPYLRMLDSIPVSTRRGTIQRSVLDPCVGVVLDC